MREVTIMDEDIEREIRKLEAEIRDAEEKIETLLRMMRQRHGVRPSARLTALAATKRRAELALERIKHVGPHS
jgi:hypothetical protein